MARGGGRPGAGRKPGARGKIEGALREMAEQAGRMQEEIPPEIAELTPLKVMLKAMWTEAAKGKWTSAALLARDAAPYVHPRLTAETHKHSFDTDALTDEQLDAEIRRETARLSGGASRVGRPKRAKTYAKECF